MADPDIRDTLQTPKGMSTCFVAMPITTPLESMARYRADGRHFAHVFEHLFMPAIAAAGMTAVPLLTQGANLVHAEIVDKIVKSDLVICDMSGLNPNVFFEMGIRTALNRPICFVVDDATAPTVPFDTGIVNYHSYASHLDPWTLPQEIAVLTAHIKASISDSRNGNALWRYFGLRAQFRPEDAQEWSASSGSEITYLTMMVETLGRKVDSALGNAAATRPEAGRPPSTGDGVLAEADARNAFLILPFDVASAATEELSGRHDQLTARLKRARTRAEESAIEDVLSRIQIELKNRRRT